MTAELEPQDAKAQARTTDPGIFIVGHEMIYDVEAETLGVPPLKKAPPLPGERFDEKPPPVVTN